MKLIFNHELRDVTPDANGATLEYLAHCLTTSQAIMDTTARHARFCELMQARLDTKDLLDTLFTEYHPEMIMDLTTGPTALPTAIDWSLPAESKELAPTTATSILFAFFPKADPLEKLKSTLLSFLEKQEGQTPELSLRQRLLATLVKKRKHGWWEEWEIHSKHDYPEHMAFLLNKMLWMTPEDEHYLSDEQARDVLMQFPELYEPAVLNAWLKLLDFYDPEDTADPNEQAARVKRYLVMQSVTLMQYSPEEQKQKVLMALNQYFKEIIAVREAVKPAMTQTL